MHSEAKTRRGAIIRPGAIIGTNTVIDFLVTFSTTLVRNVVANA